MLLVFVTTSLYVGSQVQGVVAFQKLCDQFSIFNFLWCNTNHNFFPVMTLTDAISGARSGHMNRILKYKILELVLMMKTVIGN